MTENIGLDVGKHELVAAAHASGDGARFPNTEDGRAQLIAWIRERQPARVVLESTSTYHHVVLLALAEAALPVIVANPRHVRDFSRGLGRRAKTDALDAALLARYAAVADPAFRPIPTAAELEFKALVGRRRQLLAAITLQRNQAEAAPEALREPWFDELIAQQRALLARLETELAARIAANADWTAKTAVLRSAPGIGAVTATALLAGLPELGRATHGELAALAGLVAPRPPKRRLPPARRDRRRAGRGAHRALSAHAHRDALESGHSGVRRPPDRPAQSQNGRRRRLHAENCSRSSTPWCATARSGIRPAGLDIQHRRSCRSNLLYLPQQPSSLTPNPLLLTPRFRLQSLEGDSGPAQTFSEEVGALADSDAKIAFIAESGAGSEHHAEIGREHVGDLV